VDASQVIWITTANDESAIPEPILNRMNVFSVEPPSPEAARQIARNLYQTIRSEHGWGARFAPEPNDDLLNQLGELAPREMRRALMTGFGNAQLAKRDEISIADLPKAGLKKGQMGFLQ
jgi:ATP-dependent Lon protease